MSKEARPAVCKTDTVIIIMIHVSPSLCKYRNSHYVIFTVVPVLVVLECKYFSSGI